MARSPMMLTTIGVVLCSFAMLIMATEDEQRALGTTVNKFALDLHRLVSKGELNTFMSPYSIAVALGMVYAGADGNTRQEIGDVMGFSNHAGLSTIFGELRVAMGSNPSYALTEANGIFPNIDAEILSEYLDIIQGQYGAELRSLDFGNNPGQSADVVNDWISNKTNGLIEDMVDESTVGPNTLLLLVNAIYFKANWTYSFQPGLTGDGEFHLEDGGTINCPMMRNTFIYTLTGQSDDLNAQIVELPYIGDEVSMYIIVPDEATGLPQLEDSLSEVLLNDLITNMAQESLDLQMPKFTITQFFDLNSPLQELGLKKIFSGADFSRMTNANVEVSSITHQGLVKIDEYGTEAAAATVVAITKTAARFGREFKVDKPFLFLIRHKPSGTILFLGRVGSPVRTMMTRSAMMQMPDSAAQATPYAMFVSLLLPALVSFFRMI